MAYDARVMESIDGRLSLESAAIAVGDGQTILLIRVPNSATKPHSVRFKGHSYFPSRRERQRYSMSVREIKESTMKTASYVTRAEEVLTAAFLQVIRQEGLPYLIIGMLPIFFEDFLVDVKLQQLRQP
jgi:hypothetical protein